MHGSKTARTSAAVLPVERLLDAAEGLPPVGRWLTSTSSGVVCASCSHRRSEKTLRRPSPPGPARPPTRAQVEQSGGDRARARQGRVRPAAPPAAGLTPHPSTRVAGREQDRQLMSSQALCNAVSGRGPPREGGPGKAAGNGQVRILLAVVRGHLQRRRLAVAEDEDGDFANGSCWSAPSWRKPGQAVDPAAKISLLDGDQDLHLGCDLDHHRASQKLRTGFDVGGVVADQLDAHGGGGAVVELEPACLAAGPVPVARRTRGRSHADRRRRPRLASSRR